MTRSWPSVVIALLLCEGCATAPPTRQRSWLWSRPDTTAQQFEADRGQCRQQALLLPPSPMPPAPIPPAPSRYSYPGFSEGVAAQEYEDAMARYRAYELQRRNEFLNACMFGKGYTQVPE